jgi:hypothetical protein
MGPVRQAYQLSSAVGVVSAKINRVRGKQAEAGRLDAGPASGDREMITALVIPQSPDADRQHYADAAIRTGSSPQSR